VNANKNQSSGFALFVHRLSGGELAVLVGSVTILVSLGFKWLGGANGQSQPGQNVGGFHSWGFVVIGVMLLTTGYLVVRSPLFRDNVALPRLPIAESRAFSISGAVELAAVLLYWLQNHSVPQQFDRSLKLGWLLALGGSLITLAGGIFLQRHAKPEPEKRSAGHMTPPVPPPDE
jgi:hypothetical protein